MRSFLQDQDIAGRMVGKADANVNEVEGPQQDTICSRLDSLYDFVSSKAQVKVEDTYPDAGETRLRSRPLKQLFDNPQRFENE
jgi:hypothetical protein